MTQYFDSPAYATVTLRPPRPFRQLLLSFWALAGGLLGFELFWAQTDSWLLNAGAALITIAALLPSYLWCAGRALGMPIFPFFALTFTWTHALPLVTNHPTVSTYSIEDQLFASLTVTGFLTLGAAVWYRLVKRMPPLPSYYRTLDSRKGDQFFLTALLVSVCFDMSNYGGWLFLTGGVFTALRSAVLALSALSIFVLSYRLGARELSKQRSLLFLLLLISSMITSTIGLLLVGAASSFIVAVLGFILGRKTIPFATIAVMLVCLSLLHVGKGEMRVKYMFSGVGIQVQPWEYSAWYGEWIGYTLEYVNRPRVISQTQVAAARSQQQASFTERASVMQILLMAQDRSPDPIPYMYGKTYAILPQVVVPRILNPNKIASHEGTYLLNIHYKRQTREQTRTTTIGWGLLAESYANFGLLGCAGLAIVLGTLYGQAGRWSINAPILSAQSLFAVLMITFSFQSEWSAGVYVAALFQSGVVLGGIVVVLMRSYPVLALPAFQES